MKVLINRSDAIGDTLLTSPMAQLIKERYPDAKVGFIISEKCRDLFEKHPYVDDIFVWKGVINLKSLISFFWTIKKYKASAFFYVGGSHIPTFFSWFLRIKIRGGLRSKWQSFLFLNHGKRQKRSFVEMHESDYNLHLLRPLDIVYDFSKKSNYKPRIILDKKQRSEAYQYFVQDVKQEKIVFKDDMIFIHPGMTGHTLNWPPENYVKIIARIEKNYPDKYLFVVSYTPADKQYIADFDLEFSKEEYKYLQSKVYKFNGAIKGLRNFINILDRARMIIGPSTGTIHIANSLGIKVVSLYSPIKVQSAKRWGPFDRDQSLTRVVVPDVVCGEQFHCLGDICPYYECMLRIEIADVFKEISDLLES